MIEKTIFEETKSCPRCGTLTFIDFDELHNNPKNSLLRMTCANCGYDAPVKYDSIKGWIEWQ